MGQNHGRINRITEESIELTELIPDGIGGYIERRATLALAGTEGSAKR
jgi:type IV pilus assembly protein PilP